MRGKKWEQQTINQDQNDNGGNDKRQASPFTLPYQNRSYFSHVKKIKQRRPYNGQMPYKMKVFDTYFNSVKISNGNKNKSDHSNLKPITFTSPTNQNQYNFSSSKSFAPYNKNIKVKQKIIRKRNRKIRTWLGYPFEATNANSINVKRSGPQKQNQSSRQYSMEKLFQLYQKQHKIKNKASKSQTSRRKRQKQLTHRKKSKNQTQTPRRKLKIKVWLGNKGSSLKYKQSQQIKSKYFYRSDTSDPSFIPIVGQQNQKQTQQSYTERSSISLRTDHSQNQNQVKRNYRTYQLGTTDPVQIAQNFQLKHEWLLLRTQRNQNFQQWQAPMLTIRQIDMGEGDERESIGQEHQMKGYWYNYRKNTNQHCNSNKSQLVSGNQANKQKTSVGTNTRNNNNGRRGLFKGGAKLKFELELPDVETSQNQKNNWAAQSANANDPAREKFHFYYRLEQQKKNQQFIDSRSLDQFTLQRMHKVKQMKNKIKKTKRKMKHILSEDIDLSVRERIQKIQRQNQRKQQEEDLQDDLLLGKLELALPSLKKPTQAKQQHKDVTGVGTKKWQCQSYDNRKQIQMTKYNLQENQVSGDEQQYNFVQYDKYRLHHQSFLEKESHSPRLTKSGVMTSSKLQFFGLAQSQPQAPSHSRKPGGKHNRSRNKTQQRSLSGRKRKSKAKVNLEKQYFRYERSGNGVPGRGRLRAGKNFLDQLSEYLDKKEVAPKAKGSKSNKYESTKRNRKNSLLKGWN